MAGGKFKKFLRKIAPLAVGLIPGIGPIAGGLLKAGIGTLTAGMNARDAAREQQKAAAGQPGIASLMSGMGGMGGGGGGGAPEAAAPAPFTTNTASVNPYAAEGPASSYAAAPQGLRSLQPSQMNYGQNEQAMFNAPQQEPQQEQDYAYGGPVYLAQGGIAGLQQHEYKAGGQYLSGPGDGMSDNIMANIEGRQEARLADGEFVIPADVVSHIGNGSSNAGAKKLHAMMAQIRKARTGNPKQGKQIKPEKYLPA
jgi:hypothetical protein